MIGCDRFYLTYVVLWLLSLYHNQSYQHTTQVLSKIDRVKFGLLKPEDIERSNVRAGHQIPKSRRLLAVPFVGKDVPSDASEFSHPDIVIGLTALAYRYEGLRRSDMRVVLKQLKQDLQEETGPYHKRPTCKTYVKWVTEAGGEVRGMKSLQNTKYDTKESKQDTKEEEEDKTEVWQLQLLDMADEEQEELVYGLLCKQPKLIEYYLHNFIFPETMENQGLRLCATGQALGGDLLFGRRLGFSGTPSNLLPLELGDCVYEKGSLGKMVTFLTSKKIVSARFVDNDWSVESLLKSVAENSKYDALIDTGALITGYTNQEVAESLLKFGLDHKDGVVFLDRADRKMIVLRKGLKVLPLNRCSIPLTRRFAFYDQVHTTGMDIKHCIDGKAALTLGKDMTFRDFAQGAFRMRGIGKGQTIELMIIPEVRSLIKKVTDTSNILVDVAAWLVVNACKSQKVQFNLLCEQSVSNVWRKTAFRVLETHHREVGVS